MLFPAFHEFSGEITPVGRTSAVGKDERPTTDDLRSRPQRRRSFGQPKPLGQLAHGGVLEDQ